MHNATMQEAGVVDLAQFNGRCVAHQIHAIEQKAQFIHPSTPETMTKGLWLNWLNWLNAGFRAFVCVCVRGRLRLQQSKE